jgi:hypothetical protein
MKTIVAAAALAIAVATPALAHKHRHHAPALCTDARQPFTLVEMLFSTGPEPQGNGCAPAVYEGGRFIGQDPDPNVRLELRRNSGNEGYHFDAK